MEHLLAGASEPRPAVVFGVDEGDRITLRDGVLSGRTAVIALEGGPRVVVTLEQAATWIVDDAIYVPGFVPCVPLGHFCDPFSPQRDSSHATLLVQDGSRVEAATTLVGSHLDPPLGFGVPIVPAIEPDGTVAVVGEGSSWTTSGLVVGRAGRGPSLSGVGLRHRLTSWSSVGRRPGTYPVGAWFSQPTRVVGRFRVSETGIGPGDDEARLTGQSEVRSVAPGPFPSRGPIRDRVASLPTASCWRSHSTRDRPGSLEGAAGEGQKASKAAPEPDLVGQLLKPLNTHYRFRRLPPWSSGRLS
jgi:hypothetical protein